jgi:hypothetical protein
MDPPGYLLQVSGDASQSLDDLSELLADRSHGTGQLADPTGRRGDVVQRPFAVARVEATTKRVPEPAKWVWPAFKAQRPTNALVGLPSAMSLG